MMAAKTVLWVVVLGFLSGFPLQWLSARAAGPDAVYLTWMSVTNWLFEVGDTRIVMDGYITRIPQSAFTSPNFASALPATPDVPAIQRVIDALDGHKKVDFILTGHSHYDHSFDTAVWARLTGAHIIGSRSTCLQAVAQGIPESRCTAVEGGEVLPLGSEVTVRVVRWNHSGDISTPFGRLLQAPLELIKAPTVRPESGGMGPGILQDFPNGGGARAYLFTVETAGGSLNWFYSNTGNATTFQQPVVVEAEFFADLGLSLDNLEIVQQETAARDNLVTAMASAGLDEVDLWIGFSDRDLAEGVADVLRPKAHIPHHWDGLFSPFFAGLPFPFSQVPGATAVQQFFASRRITFLPPRQYMDKYKLDTQGITAVPNREVKQRLGFAEVSHAVRETTAHEDIGHAHEDPAPGSF
jgi:L-ascorbate metabolism protein UlaG (beta-lactamase superfamily)